MATALGTVSADPEMRLRMILGEAYQKYADLIRWIGAELEKDERKAPGLEALARKFASDPMKPLLRGISGRDGLVVAIQQGMLEDAVRELRNEHDQPEPLTIEHQY